ncbi:NYN domain-containing protein [Aquihabitans daechungensis]|uniref:NYN domain-containing protein n=1 Tax=Aquihabitans daechungensis TaxID=1052257 RepID=UPI003BA029D4
MNELQTVGRRSGRTLHLIDVENLIGDPMASDEEVTSVIAAYKQAAGVRPGDLAVVASNGRLAMAAGLAWPGALLRVGRGPDGADLALLAEAPVEDVARRFTDVVVGSGDGIFVDLVRQLRLRGRRVTVVARPGSVARQLRYAADVRPMPAASGGPASPLGEAA